MANDVQDSRLVTQIRLRAALFLVLALGAGGGAVWLVKQYLDRVRGAAEAAAPDTVPVVVAAMDIPIATRIEQKHLAIVQWPKQHAPAGVIGKMADVVDHTVQTGLVKGEPVLNERLADESEGRGLAALLAPGIRAMAVRVDSVIGVAGFVQPGDFVDVITTMSPDEQTQKDLGNTAARISKIILQNIMVLAVGEHLTTEGNKPVAVQAVTLAVSPEQSERLALASQHGTITLTMRPRIDQAQEPTEGMTPSKLLAPDDADALAAQPPQVVLRTVTRRRRPEPAPAAAAVVEQKPQAPVVEILRGTRVEERTLRVPQSQ